MSIIRGKGPGINWKEIHDPVRGVKHFDWGIDFLCQYIDSGELDMNPDYQRGHVWTFDQQMDFVGFRLEGGRPPECFVRELPIEEEEISGRIYEVVDGKQRMTALHAWWNGEIPARLSNGRIIHVTEMDEVEVRFVKRAVNTSVQVLDTDRKKTLQIYLRLNRGGTPHSEEEISRVRDLLNQESQ